MKKPELLIGLSIEMLQERNEFTASVSEASCEFICCPAPDPGQYWP